MDFKYVVPIIPNLNHIRIIEIAEVLDHVSNVAENIFNQVNMRMETCRNKLLHVSQRVDIINEKIIVLRGTKKATQVFSSSKYPASDIYGDYTSVLHDMLPTELKKQEAKVKNVLPVNDVQHKLHFYHINVSSYGTENKLEGLGDMTVNVNFVNDLLLYNSGKNVYENFVITDAIKGWQNIREDEDTRISEIGAAPYSISDRSTVTRSLTQNYSYTPQIGELPHLDVPLDLPDLPGIADDLQYHSEFVDTTPHVTENIPNLSVIDAKIEFENDIVNVDLLPLPPPPPSEGLPALLDEPSELPVKPNSTKNNEVSPVLLENNENELHEKPNLFQHDIRSSLMEDIRKAGGLEKARLKSFKEKKEQTAPRTGGQGGDLVKDLHYKLFMRRKGISGIKKNTENYVDPESTLGKISAMIPAPEVKNDFEFVSNDEQDWE